MKPDTQIAMRELLKQVKIAIPLDMTEGQMCSGECHGCSRKLLEFLAGEIQGWEDNLNRGYTPSLGEVSALAKSCRKIYRALARAGLVSGRHQRVLDHTD